MRRYNLIGVTLATRLIDDQLRGPVWRSVYISVSCIGMEASLHLVGLGQTHPRYRKTPR